MGPQRSLTSLINEVHSQTAEVNSFVNRLRQANRRLTGSTGESPTVLGAGAVGRLSEKVDEMPPLMVALTTAMENLNSATADLRAEVGYLETLSETGEVARGDAPDKWAGPAAATGSRY